MKSFLINAGMVGAVALGLFAAPSQAATILTFNSSGTGINNIVTPNNGGTVTSIDVTNFSGITVAGANADNGTWTLSASPTFIWNSGADDYVLSGTLTCSFAANGCGTSGTNVSVNGNLIQINLAAAPTVAFTNGNTTATIAISNATTISESITFLNDLGLTTPSSSKVQSGAFLQGIGSACTTGPCNFTDQSNVLQITLTPEPYSFALFGGGLMLVGFIARRRKMQSQSVAVKQ